MNTYTLRYCRIRWLSRPTELGETADLDHFNSLGRRGLGELETVEVSDNFVWPPGLWPVGEFSSNPPTSRERPPHGEACRVPPSTLSTGPELTTESFSMFPNFHSKGYPSSSAHSPQPWRASLPDWAARRSERVLKTGARPGSTASPASLRRFPEIKFADAAYPTRSGAGRFIPTAIPTRPTGSCVRRSAVDSHFCSCLLDRSLTTKSRTLTALTAARSRELFGGSRAEPELS